MIGQEKHEIWLYSLFFGVKTWNMFGFSTSYTEFMKSVHEILEYIKIQLVEEIVFVVREWGKER